MTAFEEFFVNLDSESKDFFEQFYGFIESTSTQRAMIVDLQDKIKKHEITIAEQEAQISELELLLNKRNAYISQLEYAVKVNSQDEPNLTEIRRKLFDEIQEGIKYLETARNMVASLKNDVENSTQTNTES